MDINNLIKLCVVIIIIIIVNELLIINYNKKKVRKLRLNKIKKICKIYLSRFTPESPSEKYVIERLINFISSNQHLLN